MSTPVLYLRALSLLLTLCLVASAGCSRNRIEPKDSPVRPFLQEVVTQFDQGHNREGVALLLGTKITDTAWERAQRQALEALHPGARTAAEECAHNLALLQTTIELYQGDEQYGGGRLPTRLQDLIRMGGMKAIPTCPAAGRDTYSDGYKVLQSGEGYRICCQGAHHRDAGIKAGFPAVDSRFGPLMALDSSAGWNGRLHLEVVEVRRTDAGYEATLRESIVKEGVSPAPSPAVASPASGSPLPGAATTSISLAIQPVPGSPGRFRLVPATTNARKGVLPTLAGACADAATAPPAATASREACTMELRHVATALEMYSSDHEGRYPQRLEQLVPRYLWRMPSCQGDEGGPPPTYQVSRDGEQYELGCQLHPDVHLSTQPTSRGRTSGGAASPGSTTQREGNLGATP